MSGYKGIARSTAIYKEAGELIPGHTQLIGRRAYMYASGVSPNYAERAKGSRFVDVDGNEYIDWLSCFTAVILGHADEVVNAAVKEQIDRGSLFSVNNPLEVELARLLVETIPSAEMCRYTRSGGEACAVAVRIARGTKNRDKILFCGYHGWHDWYQSANYLVDPDNGEFPFSGIEPIGVPRVLAGTAIPFVYGDLEMLENLLKENHGEVAAIMMEPARSKLPEPGYLEAVQALAREHDVILIFDEVSCGWRISLGGVQEVVGVTPDMTVLAKAISNGYPMGAIVGSREAMEPAARMFLSSSYWSDNVGLAASVTTIRELKRRNSTERFAELNKKVTDALNGAIEASGLKGRCAGLHPAITFDPPDPSLAPKVSTLFMQEMCKRGCFGLSFISTLAHTDEDIQETVVAAKESMEVIKSGLDSGDLDRLLECDTKQDVFRRLVS